ncbi:MAG: L-threonylcarbamoyladenylate synthase [Thermoguttaceae bacterium]|nr:L-threonylcarbamoyladenylate synthase [Thermoguttaceae bacterium]
MNLASMQGTERDIYRIVESLKLGGILVLPTETVYGLAVLLSRPNAVARLSNFKGRKPGHAFSLAVPDYSWVRKMLPQISPLAERFARRCWPGPLTLVLDASPLGIAVPEAIRQLIAPSGTLGIRVPSHQVTCSILHAVGEPIVLTSANISGNTPACTAHEATESLPAGVDIVVDGGPCEYSEASTVVRVHGWEYEILREGVIKASTLHQLASRMIVFACTGNTCRSPMAEVICRALLERHQKRVADTEQICDLAVYEEQEPLCQLPITKHSEHAEGTSHPSKVAGAKMDTDIVPAKPEMGVSPPEAKFDTRAMEIGQMPESVFSASSVESGRPSPIPTKSTVCAVGASPMKSSNAQKYQPEVVEILSAGIAAFDGDTASPHAKQAMHLLGLSLDGHQSTQLDERLVRCADAIYVMSKGHRQAIISRWPKSASRVHLLDPDGRDIVDPYGMPLQTYQDCAAQIQRALERRLPEFVDFE